MTILDNIVASTRSRIAAAELAVPLEAVRAVALSAPVGDFPFERALKARRLSFICEIKKASPSKGVISDDFPYANIATDYERAGADAISVLTEPNFFLGDNAHLSDVSALVSIPTLRKDFIVGPYQVYEAKTLGAAAVLLIAAILTDAELRDLLALAHTLGLSALTETRTEDEVKRALSVGARVVGVNCRDLRTFDVDMGVPERLRRLVPKNVTFVAESGIHSPDDIHAIEAAKPDGVLIGESMMRADDKAAFLSGLREAATW